MRRRHAAIAFADIVGYTILTAADEIGTHERWFALYRGVVAPEARRHGGRVAELRGDGVLAEFPDAAAALAWARALHAASLAASEAEPQRPPIAFRVAIHCGPVLASAEGVFGDTVNLAARLQEYGTPGGTVLSREALAALPEGAAGPARDLGDLPLRNLSRTVRAFAIEGPAGVVPVPLPPPPARLPSVAVLPLENRTGDPARDYLAEGIVEDVIASLAGLHEVFVIAQDSARMFRGQRPDPLRVGRTLGVRFVVTGSLRSTGRGLRVSVQLTETAGGAMLWGDRFDAPQEDIFELQERIVGQVVAGIAPNVRASALREAMRKRPESLTSYDLLLRGLHALAGRDRGPFRQALDHLRRAAAEDPGFALPLAWAARWHSLNIGRGWSADPAADNAAAMALAERAIALDPGNALALATYGHLAAYLRHDCETAMRCFEQALAACPNSALAWTLSSCTLSYLGRGGEAVRHAERGLRLSPYDPLRFSQHHFLSIAHYANEELARAERWSRASIGANPDHASSWRVLAAALAAQGRTDEAAEAARRMLESEPGFRLEEYVRARMPFREPALRARFARDLRAAGLP
ncbi:adenylate/guanylate cyclase domain-containing protein [Crenalkalicoccus roseus]|uniref:adenylate/guanylate cyclase domain-containing protein n=1 Tax=Crenalkalicoccus roseus TaxID=1485588 RepID=UPI001305164A|nr:adenylate/guanylate cyclase domain-containing protein [Crenalkalicoccus roseus]